MTEERAVSTVIDVALALLVISASILVLGLYLHDGGEESLDPDRADRTAETLGSSTLSVEYDVSAVKESDNFTEPEGATPDRYRRVDYGAALGLIADAAVTNVHVDDRQLLAYGDDYEDAVDANVRSNLIGLDENVFVQARWEPYDGAAIAGDATVGERPSDVDDVSSNSLTASSGLPAAADEIEGTSTESTVNETIQRASEPIAAAIVEGYFPPEDTQHSLESQGMYRSLKTYHYETFGQSVGVAFSADEPPLERTEADAPAANERLVTGGDASIDGNISAENATGLRDVIAHDIRTAALAEEIDAIEDELPPAERPEAVRDLIAESVSTGEVTISIQVWQR